MDVAARLVRRSEKNGSRLPRSMAEGRSSWRSVGKMILLILGISLCLSVFVLMRQRLWRGKGLRAIILVHDTVDVVRKPLTLITIDSLNNKVVMAPLPAAQRLPVALTYGSYTVDALVGLTQLEKLRWDFLRLSLSLELGVAVDDIIWTKQTTVTTLGQLQGLAAASLWRPPYTTMTFWDRFTLWRQLMLIPSYQVETVKMADYLQADSTLDAAAWDRAQPRWWLDRTVRQSGLSIVVQNGSGVSGYANRLSRALGLMGFAIRQVENIPDEPKTIILTKDRSSWNSAQQWAWSRLTTLLAPFPVRTDAAAADAQRVDMVIRLGKDQSRLFRLNQ